MLQIATMMIPKAELAIAVPVDAMAPRWKVGVHMLSQRGWTADAVIELANNRQPGPQVISQARSVVKTILSEGSMRVALRPYQPTDDMTDYRLRLE